MLVRNSIKIDHNFGPKLTISGKFLKDSIPPSNRVVCSLQFFCPEFPPLQLIHLERTLQSKPLSAFAHVDYRRRICLLLWCVSAASPDIVEQVKHEMHQSIVETGTKICENVSELRIEMHRTRGELVAAAERAGLQVAAAGTHPFSSWIDQVISPGERYQHIVEELQQLARSLLIFGMHVHVAMPDKQTTIDMMNMVRYFLPHLLALSTSSPFWMGRNTGLKSFRTTVFRRFRAPAFPNSFESWSAYEIS